METTRDLVLRTWRTVARDANDRDGVRLNRAALVGLLLAASGGDLDLARSGLPELDDSAFWARVRETLDAIATEDMAADFGEDLGTIAFLDEVLA
jgi:hypothetical protein